MVLSQVFAVSSEENTILGFKEYEKKYDWNIQGALVQDIITGYHKYVLTYDFTSLYPSIILAYNLCQSTFVEQKDYDKYDEEELNIIDWVEHKFCGCTGDPHNGKKGKNDRILCSKNENMGTKQEGHYHFRFKKVIYHRNKNNEIIKRENEGLYPRFLRKLLSKRKEIKKQIKILNKWVFGDQFGSKKDRSVIDKWTLNIKLDGEEQKIINNYQKYLKTCNITKENLEFIREAIPKNIYISGKLNKECVYLLLITLVVLDKKQLAIKISANSGYGGLGTETSALCFKPGAACTTAMGRKLITQGIEHTREKFTAKRLSDIFDREIKEGFQLVYGDTDSFMGCFPSLSISESWKMIDYIQKELDNGIFPDPIHLEFECMYGKYFQLSKKCYVSWMMEPKEKNIITDDEENDWIVTEKIKKGVVSSRRDNCKYTTIGFDELMDMAINEEKQKDMRYYVADYAYKLMGRGMRLRDLIITKGVGNLEDYEKEDEDGNMSLNESRTYQTCIQNDKFKRRRRSEYSFRICIYS